MGVILNMNNLRKRLKPVTTLHLPTKENERGKENAR